MCIRDRPDGQWVNSGQVAGQLDGADDDKTGQLMCQSPADGLRHGFNGAAFTPVYGSRLQSSSHAGAASDTWSVTNPVMVRQVDDVRVVSGQVKDGQPGQASGQLGYGCSPVNRYQWVDVTTDQLRRQVGPCYTCLLYTSPSPRDS